MHIYARFERYSSAVVQTLAPMPFTLVDVIISINAQIHSSIRVSRRHRCDC